MSLNNIKSNTSAKRGFTIVELLIVIVVIGILAAITIVAYNGVTARANTTSAQAAAANVLKKAEAYNAEEAGYPVDPDQLTTADSGEVYNLTGVTFLAAAGVDGTAPGNNSTVGFFTCENGLGVAVEYYDFQNAVWVQETTGDCATTPAPTIVAPTP